MTWITSAQKEIYVRKMTLKKYHKWKFDVFLPTFNGNKRILKAHGWNVKHTSQNHNEKKNSHMWK
jgi:hypothetical protein